MMVGEEDSSSFKVGVGSSLRVEYTLTQKPVLRGTITIRNRF